MSIFNRVLAVRYMDYIHKGRNVSQRTYNNQLKMACAFSLGRWKNTTLRKALKKLYLTFWGGLGIIAIFE